VHRSDLGLIKKAERFARIDLDRSRFEKERNQCPMADVEVSFFTQSIIEALD